MKSKKKILILGGEGFIGRNLADYLSLYYDCYSVGNKKSVFKSRKDRFIKKNPYREKIAGNFDVIIHLIDNKVDIADFEKMERKLIKNLNLNEKKHLIVFSSAVIYANPDSEYGQRKIKLEKIHRDYCAINRIRLTIFRLFNTYGPYQFPNRQGSLIANILVNYLCKKETEINDRKTKRDFIFSRDIGKFVDHAIANKLSGRLDLACNKLVSIDDVIRSCEKVIGDRIPINYKNLKEDKLCVKAKSELAKKIKLTSLVRGFKEALAFYKLNLKIINK